jgi:hypothetical protein
VVVALTVRPRPAAIGQGAGAADRRDLDVHAGRGRPRRGGVPGPERSGRSLPSWLANSAVADAPWQTLRGMRRILAEEKYRSARPDWIRN